MIALRDIHCHLLPGLDDGPKDHREAVALARTLVDQGIDTVVATPHQLGRYEFNHAELILGRLRQFNELLQREDVHLRVVPGADVRVDERLVNLIREHKVLTLNNGGRYLLLEMPHETRIEARGMINSLMQLGIRPIISHPERHRPAQQHPEMVG
ncbi:MAG: hypothetical protein QF662_07420, partial [Phycisphaerae bacterium]|nr:hypothetical protein [Phycisphaerae bacterium]